MPVFDDIESPTTSPIDPTPQAPAQPTAEEIAKAIQTEKNKSSAQGCGCLLLIVVIVFAWAVLSTDTTPDAPLTEEQRRTQELEKHFSAWDGSHKGLVKYVKDRLNDPDSFEHVETKYGDKGNVIVLNMTYRAKNAFGGVVTKKVGARADLNGNVLEVIEIE